MAKIHEESIILTVSRLIKNDETVKEEISNELVSAIASVAHELIQERIPGIVVEGVKFNPDE